MIKTEKRSKKIIKNCFDSEKRLKKLKKLITEKDITGFLVKDIKNINYLSNFTGSTAWLLITADNNYFLTDSRYIEQAGYETKGFIIIKYVDTIKDVLLEITSQEKVREIHYEADIMTVKELLTLKKAILETNLDLKLIPGPNLTSELRMIKEPAEVEIIREAIKISEETLQKIIPLIKPGISERDIAIELEYHLKKNGAEMNAFNFIVASGERSSMPHSLASLKTINFGEVLLIDFGIIYQSYHSDITRTFFIGRADDKAVQIYNIVKKAQETAIECISSEMKAVDLDGCARKIIDDNNFGKFFGHGLGHGIGL
ncbi:MAG: aminopeptidase P family protein, partial [Actinomycetia bacterium]|nr:aminopeptidase P family protein [Actinomycetes bacterium]